MKKGSYSEAQLVRILRETDRDAVADVAKTITARSGFRIWDDNYSSVLAVLK